MDGQDCAWGVLGARGAHRAEQEACEAAVSATADDEDAGAVTRFQEDLCGADLDDVFPYRDRRPLAEHLGDIAVPGFSASRSGFH